MTVAVDSSFIASLYLRDSNLAEAARRMSRFPLTWLTILNRCELAHAIQQYVFRAAVTAVEARLAWENFEKDCVAGIWIPIDLPEDTWKRSISLARQFGPTLGVRTLDSLHVAAALELNAQKFWTFDERQAKLAEGAGLDTTP